jgi:hypothetical protein
MERHARIVSFVTRLLVRVTLASMVGLIVVVVIGKFTRAHAERALLDVGANMLRYADAIVEDRPRAIEFNGTQLWLAAGVTDRPVDDVLGFFTDRCRPGGDLADDLAALEKDPSRADDAAAGDEPAPLGGALRGGDDQSGFVACLDGTTLSATELVERARAFSASGDLGVLGAIRYVYAERRDGKTHYVAFWHEGRLVISEIFPAAGDAPGQDSPVAERPPGSRRLLSMHESGRPYATTIYSGSSLGVAELEAFYREQLAGGGWELVDSPRRRQRPDEAALFAFRGGIIAIIVIGDDPAGVSTTIMTSTPEDLERRRMK